MLPRLYDSIVAHLTRSADASGRSRRQRRLANETKKRRGFESLEHRTLLAASDLTAIAGTVYRDFSGNGFNAGEQIAGASLQLYKDGGNGVFGGDDVAVGSPTTTNAQGVYRFEGLAAGRYFVQQPAQDIAGVHLNARVSSAVDISAADVAGVTGMAIDTFDTTVQTVTVNSNGGATDSSAVLTSDALGGERDLSVTISSPAGSVALSANSFDQHLLEFMASATAVGTRVATWDGVDHAATTLNPTGLGGVDLTSAGASNALTLIIGADQPNGIATLRVYKDASNWSKIQIAIPDTGGAATSKVYATFSSFAIGAGTGADFSKVGAIQLEIEGIAAVDGQIDLLGAIGPKVFKQDFANFEPADLSLTKTVSNPNPNVGQNVTFTVSVANAGPQDATGVKVSDPLPSGVTFVSATPSQGTFDPATGIWTVGRIASGAGASLAVVVTAATTGMKTNVAQISASDQFDPDSTPGNSAPTEDDQASATIQPLQVDLSLTKTIDDAGATVGQNATYTIIASNAGPAGATNVKVSDPLPAGVSYVSSTAGQGSFDPASGIWTIGAIGVGGSAQLKITVKVNSTGVKTNVAQISAADQPDIDSTPNNSLASEDDQASVTLTPRVIDLSLTKSIDDAGATVGQNATYTIIVSNSGPSPATNVQVSDPLPAGLSFVSAAAGQGSFDSATGIWTIGAMPVGAKAQLAITVKVNSAGAKTNTAQVSSASEPDIDSSPNNNLASEDDQASVTLTPRMIDLSLTKSIDVTTATLGQNVTYTVTARNAGPAAATNVQVSDPLPSGLSFVNATPSQGTFDSATGIWTIGGIAVGGQATLSIVATVTAPGAKTNVAQVSAADQADIDSTPNNNLASEDDQASVTFTPAFADLSLRKFVSTPNLRLGQQTTFTVVVTNAGPSTATGVQVSDNLPTGLVYVSSAPSQGAYDPLTGIWNIGSIPVGGQVTLNMVATITATGTKTNTARIVGLDQAELGLTALDGDPVSDNQDSVTVAAADPFSKRLFLAR